jgi:hypothetical protein
MKLCTYRAATNLIFTFFVGVIKKILVLQSGEMAEWSIAAVLKTVEGYTSWGSNPYFSAQAQ